jgi:shikimate kinase
VGRLLAAKLGWNFTDADEHTETIAGKSIAAIFASEGETGFRDREAATLRELCGRDCLVLATGGGAVLRPANRDLLRATGFVVWLKATPRTVWERLQGDPTTASRRPNLTPAGGFEEVQALIEARTPIYRDLADFTADTDAASPEALAAAILTAWNGGCTRPLGSGVCSSSPSG